MKSIQIYDVTLRDGSNANNQGFSSEFYNAYIDRSYQAGLRAIEVGHGYGLGGSSLHIARLQDLGIWNVVATKARQYPDLRIGAHLIPGLATLEDINRAIDQGVSIFRIASHCTEADISEAYIQYVARKGLEPWGLLMMCHMTSPENLVEEAIKLASFGSSQIVFLDSAGSLTPKAVQNISELLVSNVGVPIGFHAHNNLNAAVANSLVAMECGCQSIDASACGYGPGAGNLSLESFAAILQQEGIDTGIDIAKLLELASIIEESFSTSMPRTNSISTATGFHGLFSGFKPKILEAANEFHVNALDLIEALGKQQVIAGQEDQIIATARILADSKFRIGT
jgi:4-hydroxy 2-oxovalerate aldolase